MKKLSSVIASPSDRENLVFEIWSENNQVAEISNEPGKNFEIEIYTPAEGASWSFELDEFKGLLEQAITSLKKVN
ncbi:hypothetical protein [Pseudomonas syringae group genomosp. 7]|uniref:hypothetical protein n=1 Tax=Pseudomonas syringae group genomosp. 7 TaxID=251699 RepID=UPI0009EBF70A|nr:hypothetical protein [Pseudomonas syringae group genomosp. 7]UNB62311.1 hypothetical protein MME54_22215 [Pseudomonas syringae pv. helianthi]